MMYWVERPKNKVADSGNWQREIRVPNMVTSAKNAAPNL